ncbi:MAG: hypothetical protein K2L42_00175 [Clostridia bacterium]|nr:hypothetical protein [Clostridia bacterium]
MNVVDGLLVAAFLFFVGSVLGWCIEVLFRRVFTAKKWINPGFLTGPYLPLYGFGVAGLFGISLIPIDTGYPALDGVIIIAIMGVAMTVIEYIAGLIFIKGMKIRLWDYSNRKGNIQGIICPLFSFFWLAVSAFYYYVIDPYVIEAVIWFVHHMAFAFVVGLFFGVFLVDLGHSVNFTAKIRAFAKKRGVVVSFEKLKESIKDKIEAFGKKKASFIFPFKSENGLAEELENYTRGNCAADKNEDINKNVGAL